MRAREGWNEGSELVSSTRFAGTGLQGLDIHHDQDERPRPSGKEDTYLAASAFSPLYMRPHFM